MLSCGTLRIINVYVPNIDVLKFLEPLMKAATNYLGTEMVAAGDLNCVLYGELDYEPPKADTKPGITEALREQKLQNAIESLTPSTPEVRMWVKDVAEWAVAEESHMHKHRRDANLADDLQAWAALLADLLEHPNARTP
ncbi:hypothetical protein NDU88_004769 [Pleurodeles waltl]|uniref:Uncharacterized protein n=1 Tax=Pleurodeles waltl TaxID=8319 RepID=A0AAV7PDS9_PLEWA|nr:hypothetical protein NDU88_004769 [Pleurodeles waltl]